MYATDEDPIPVMTSNPNAYKIFMNVSESKTFNSNSYDPDDGTDPGDGIVQWKWDIYDYNEAPYYEPWLSYFIYQGIDVNSSCTFSPIALGLGPGRYAVDLNVLDNDGNWVNGFSYYWINHDWRGTRDFYIPGIKYLRDQSGEDEHCLPTGTGETFHYYLLPGEGAEWEPDVMCLYIKDASDNYVYMRYLIGSVVNDPNIPLNGESATLEWNGLGNQGSYSGQPLPPGNYTITLYISKSGYTAYETNPLTIFGVRIVTPCGDPKNPSDANEYNERAFNSNSPGVLTVLCTAIPTPEIPMGIWDLFNFNDNKLRWTITSITGSTLTWDSSWPGASTKGEGTSCEATFTGLPSSNDSFGIKEVKLEFLPDGTNVTSTKTTNIEVFFNTTATNNPGGTNPNWYYYWLSAYGSVSNISYNSSIDYGFCSFISPSAIAIGDSINTALSTPYDHYSDYGYTRPTVDGKSGIDLFYSILTHELQHRTDLPFYGNTPDSDSPQRDYLPDSRDPYPYNYDGAINGLEYSEYSGTGEADWEYNARQVEDVTAPNNTDWSEGGKEWRQ